MIDKKSNLREVGRWLRFWGKKPNELKCIIVTVGTNTPTRYSSTESKSIGLRY